MRYVVGVDSPFFRIQVYVVRDCQEVGDNVVCICKTYDRAEQIATLLNKADQT